MRGKYNGRFDYRDAIFRDDDYTPPESNPPRYEDPILPGGRPVPPSPIPPQDEPAPVPPADVPIDPGLGGGDGSGSSSGTGPSNDFTPHMMYDPVTGQGYMANTFQDHLYYQSLGYVHDAPVPVDPGLGGGDGSGSSSGTGPSNDFTPHMMYDPVTGQGYMANTFQDHLYYQSLGYVHEKPGGNGNNGQNDFTLIGIISLLFFGGLILGLRK